MQVSFRHALKQLPYLVRAVSLVWTAAPRWTAAWAVLLVIQGLLPVASVYLTRILVDQLVVVVEGTATPEAVQPLLLTIGLMVAIAVVAELLRSFTNTIRTAQSELVQDHISQLVHEQAVSVDLAFYDSPDYFDHLHRSIYDATYRPLRLLENLGLLLQNTITLVAMAGVLLQFGFILPLALLASSLPALYVAVVHRKRLHHWRLEATATERRAWYYNWLLTARETAAEIRLFDLGPDFRSRYQEVRQQLREQRLALVKGQGVGELAAGFSGLLALGAALAWMIWQALQGLVSLGDLALFYQAFTQGQRLMRSLLDNLGEFYFNGLFLQDLFDFLELQPQVVDPSRPREDVVPVKAIAFEGVTFSYPGSNKPTLENFDLQIAAGQVTAIVGTNGAGKSTLVKLLCRLYDPAAGRVTIDEVDLRQLRLAQLRRNMTVLFQEPVQYNASVEENIAYGDAKAATPDEVQKAAQAAGADTIIRELPQGFQTPLGKWFAGGSDLSVGEWQRLALARTYLRNAPLVILDEPTSAMDPWAEAEWLQRFRAMMKGKTAVIITHRFSTARFADQIFVMDHGQVVEAGTHDELLALDGRYAESWHAHRGRPREVAFPNQEPNWP